MSIAVQPPIAASSNSVGVNSSSPPVPNSDPAASGVDRDELASRDALDGHVPVRRFSHANTLPARLGLPPQE